MSHEPVREAVASFSPFEHVPYDFDYRCGAGYPADKPPGTMWTDSCVITIDGANTTSNLVANTCDVSSGEAGAPMLGPSNRIRAMLVGGWQRRHLELGDQGARKYHECGRVVQSANVHAGNLLTV